MHLPFKNGDLLTTVILTVGHSDCGQSCRVRWSIAMLTSISISVQAGCILCCQLYVMSITSPACLQLSRGCGSIYVRRVYIILPDRFKLPFVLSVVSTQQLFRVPMTPVVHNPCRYSSLLMDKVRTATRSCSMTLLNSQHGHLKELH